MPDIRLPRSTTAADKLLTSVSDDLYNSGDTPSSTAIEGKLLPTNSKSFHERAALIEYV